MSLNAEIYLKAFHRELCDIVAEGAPAASPRNAMVLQRIADGLQRLLLERTVAPGAMAAARAGEVTALGDLESRLGALGLPGVPSRRLRYRATRPTSTDAGADHDALLDAHAEVLSAIGAAAARDDAARPLLRAALDRAVAFEDGVRRAMRTEALRLEEERLRTGAGGRKERPLDAATLEAHLHARDPGLHALRILTLTPLWTNSSKEALLIGTNGAAGWPSDAIMRREPPYSIVVSSLADEHEVLSVAHRAGLPVPRPLFSEHDPDALDGRFIIMARADGAAGSPASHGAAAVGLFGEMAGFLAALHAIDPATVARLRPDLHRPVREVVGDRIDQYHAIWLRDRLDPSAIIEGAFAWLRANLHLIDDDRAIVHGDFDMRNALVLDGRLTAILDWELSRMGHRMEDLAYVKHEVEEAMPWADFVAAYRAAGGGGVDDAQVDFFMLWAALWRVVVVVTAYSGYGRAHQEFVFGSTAYVEFDALLDRVVGCLEKLPR